ncbi:hypothetical protein [Gemmatimonas sp.]|jgi:uncharacterized membrane protein|uniref:hypothetical protein n=1 Tax=Gemmatimonas sp. TaxID=1962908 RepID=UPI0037BFC9DA
MYGFLIAAHNVLAWLVLGVGAMVLVKGATRKGAWDAGDSSWVRRLTLLVHLQLVAGLALWFVSPTVALARATMGETMKDSALRRLVVEHPTLMIAAVIVATITSVRVRKAEPATVKSTRALVGAAITLVLVAAVIPWARLVTSWTT